MPDLSHESCFDHPVCGIDEVGRGPLAGPVVAACVYIPPETAALPFFAHVNDSKKLSAARRDEMNDLIRAHCVWGIGQASVAEIDQHNILQATFMAMRRALHAMIGLSDDQMIKNDLGSRTCSGGPSWLHGSPAYAEDLDISFDHLLALIDGNRAPKNFPVPVQTIIKGDSISLSIAAASIIAKVERDAVMAALHAQYPHYGWDTNAGYGTAAHLAGLAQHGPCPHHRSTFAPVKALLSA